VIDPLVVALPLSFIVMIVFQLRGRAGEHPVI